MVLRIVVLPSSYFDTGVNGLLVYTKSTVSPSKLKKYTVHHDAPGINGTLTEGRIMLDTFVLEAKKKRHRSYKRGLRQQGRSNILPIFLYKEVKAK